SDKMRNPDRHAGTWLGLRASRSNEISGMKRAYFRNSFRRYLADIIRAEHISGQSRRRTHVSRIPWLWQCNGNPALPAVATDSVLSRARARRMRGAAVRARA